MQDQRLLAVEATLDRHITLGDVDAVFVTDAEVRLILDRRQADAPTLDRIAGFGGGGSSVAPSVVLDTADGEPTNAVHSASQAFKLLSQLAALSGGTGLGIGTHELCISAQYSGHLLVQFLLAGRLLVTLLAKRSGCRCLGGLTALVPTLKAAPAVVDMCAAFAAADPSS